MCRMKQVLCLIAVMLFSVSSAFAGRYYMPDVGRWATPDPLAMKMPSWSPYSYTFDNPLKYIDQDGRIPILPLLVKAGANGAADLLAQASMNYLFDPNIASASDAFGSVNYWQVGRSSAEGLIPWKTPGGRLGRAAATATGDVLVNALNAGSDYSQEQALQDFATGFLGDLAGGGVGELINKYGGMAVANGFLKAGLEIPQSVLNSASSLSGLSVGDLRRVNLGGVSKLGGGINSSSVALGGSGFGGSKSMANGKKIVVSRLSNGKYEVRVVQVQNGKVVSTNTTSGTAKQLGYENLDELYDSGRANHFIGN
ncbi:MAG: hypothetical protein H6696_14285 [Deferribacteres bacterium]|nr:hypothetical protein [candidate division KSB1 bacterium]MCB9503096.1 hypothetical protein [Deferribacteres bacterium]